VYVRNVSLAHLLSPRLSLLFTEGVGKSSLISTFVSRYFAEVVPALMTRVRLPPDPISHTVTTLVDSQYGDAALVHLLTAREWQARQMGGSLPSSGSLQAFLEATGSTPSAPSTTKTTTAVMTAAEGGSSGGNLGGSSGSNTSPTAPGEASTSSPETPEALAEQVDSIILVYDLDRVETFFRLENHWLPLLERCYQGKVSCVGCLGLVESGKECFSLLTRVFGFPDRFR
jgi:hypothetical protein